MALEIERKFLLKSIPDAIYDPTETINIHQLYVSYKDEKLRIREITDYLGRWKHPEYVLTRKTELRPGVYEEYEEEITYKRFSKYKTNATKELKKLRIKIRQKNLIWEIDVYEDPIKLIVAEVELPTENYNLEIPVFIQGVLIVEVTQFPAFKNSNLAIPCRERGGSQ